MNENNRSVGTTRLKPSGYTKDGRPYWWVAGLLFYNRERAEHAAQEVAALYRTGQNNGD